MATFDIDAFLNQTDEDGAAAAASMGTAASKPKVVFDNTYFNYSGKLAVGGSSTFRFLPNGIDDLSRPDKFWVDKRVIQLDFYDPSDDTKVVRLNVPVLEMYESGKKCITLAATRDMFKAAEAAKKAGRQTEHDNLKALATKHWTTNSYIAQGFVVIPGFEEENIPENPIRLIDIKKTMLDIIINTGLKTGEGSDPLPFVPYHVNKGTNFIIRKTSKTTPDGAQNNYTTSSWARSPTALTADQIAALKQYGSHDLLKRLPPRPTDDEYKLLKEIVEYSLAGNTMWRPEWTEGFTTVKTYGMDRDVAEKWGSNLPKGGGAPVSKPTTVSMSSIKRTTETTSVQANADEVFGDETVTQNGATPDLLVEETATVAVQEETKAPVATPPSGGTSDMAARIRAQMQAKAAANKAAS